MSYEDGAKVMSTGLIEGMLKGAISKTATSAPAPTPGHHGRPRGNVDVQAAYRETREWTMEQMTNATDGDTLRATTSLEAEWFALSRDFNAWDTAGRPAVWNGKPKVPKDPGPKLEYISRGFFKEYWMLHCLQFADKLSKNLPGRKYNTLQTLIGQTNKALEHGEDVGLVKGRTTVHRGKTFAQIAVDEASNPRLAPGTSIHVKLHFNGDKPYEYADDFHHWIVWAGNGLFTDSLTGAEKAGAAMDATLQGWVHKSFGGAKFQQFHGDTTFSQSATGPGAAKPIAGLQPRVSAEYDPRVNPNQQGDGG